VNNPIAAPHRTLRGALCSAAALAALAVGSVVAIVSSSDRTVPPIALTAPAPDEDQSKSKDSSQDKPSKDKPAKDPGKDKAEQGAKKNDAKPEKARGGKVTERLSVKVGDPYPFDVCAADGAKLGGAAERVSLNGRDFRFCSEACVENFKADPDKIIAALDAKIIAEQGKNYPLKSCLIMEDEVLVAGETEDVVLNNRLFRLCCPKCVKKFNADPEKYWAKQDAAVIAALKPTYKLDTCPVSGEKLGAQGEPVDMVVANRLIRLCCKECKRSVKDNAAAVLAKVQ